jgi:hypothetical protein
VLLGHPEKRFDRIGADRQPNVLQPESGGRLELEVQLGAQLLTQRGRGHGVKQGLALSSGVVREPRGVENLLAPEQALGIGSKALDEGVAGGQLIQASAHLG